MSSQKKKTKITTKKQSSSLPDDLLLSCLARVPRVYHQTLSFASKRFGSFLASPEFYKTRSILGRTESCLYVCLRYHPDSNPRWFTLCRKPNKTLESSSLSSGYFLAEIPIPNTPKLHRGGLAAVGSNIYAISEPKPSSTVSILDCKYHTWHEAPNMLVKRYYSVVNAFDGKIYVAEGCDSSNWMEVFDPETQIWKPSSHISKSEREIYMIHDFENKVLVYKPKEDRWERLFDNNGIDLGTGKISYCVIDNVVYCFTDRNEIKWYDSTVRYWWTLIGLEELPQVNTSRRVTMVDYGGKIAVFWDMDDDVTCKVIWCAVIALERRNENDIWGNVEWCEEVLKVPKWYGIVNALSVTV